MKDKNKSQIEEAKTIYNETMVKSDKKYHDTVAHAFDVNIEEWEQARKLYDKIIASIKEVK